MKARLIRILATVGSLATLIVVGSASFKIG